MALELVNFVHYCRSVTKLHAARNWKVYVYGREHGVPHFHVLAPGLRVSVSIETLEVIAGRLPASLLAEVREWASGNRELLRRTWNHLNAR